jgi:Tetratricopeptide repeat
MCRAVAQLVSGLLLRQQGDATGARLLLTKALKQAHSVLGSTHLVAQVLNALAPVQQMKNDTEGAKQMLESAMTLTKTLGDLPSLIATLKRLVALQKESDDASVAAMTADYITRKTAELESKLAAVRASPEHQAILEWTV